MKYLLWIFMVLFVTMCIYMGYSKLSDVDDNVSEVIACDTDSVPELSDEEIDEIIRMADSVKRYGMKEGIRRFYEDTVRVSDEDSQLVRKLTHEILEELRTTKHQKYE